MKPTPQRPSYEPCDVGGALLSGTGGGALADVALEAADCFEFLARLPNESADCLWTDPPYFLSNGGITCKGGRRASVDKGLWDRSNGLTEDYRFHARWVREAYRVLRPEGTIWVTGTVHAYIFIGMALLRCGFRILNDIIWHKPCPPPNLSRRCFTHSTETVFWATKAHRGGGPRYTFNYEDMRLENGGTQMQTVWSFRPPGPGEKYYGKHPTQKPVALIMRCLRASTKPGDTVVDPFVGSGSTAVAAVTLGRRFIGCDRDPNYLLIARRRITEARRRLSSTRRNCLATVPQGGLFAPQPGNDHLS